jgi:molybdopterin-guanine dinucleotide biosynthesis protein A
MVWKARDPLTGALRDDLFLAESDARDLGLAAGDPVLVRSDSGEVTARVRISDIRPGNVQMFFPEANPLIQAGRRDPVALVPDYNATVEILPLPAGLATPARQPSARIVSTAEPTPRASGIVLAGGRSSRFGRDKLAEPVDGAPLLHLAVRAMAAACTEVLVISPPAGLDNALPRGLPTPVREVSDPTAFAGPLVGLLTGLRAATGDLVVVAAGDMPSLDPAVLRLMLRRMSERSSSATGNDRSAGYWAAHGVALESDGEPQPLPLVMERGAAISSASDLVAGGERSLRALLSALDIAVIPEAQWRALDPEGATLRDVDRPSDLSAVHA